jgi:predicted MFS family arabinose efflux permease
VSRGHNPGPDVPPKVPEPDRNPLSSRNFRLLASSNTLSVAGSSFAAIAVPFAVLGGGGSAQDVGLVAMARLLPVITFLLVGGVLADRFPRRRVLVAANAVQALAQGAGAALVLTGTARVWHLAALAAVGGLGVAVSYPASQGLLPQTVTAAQRPRAVTLDRVGRNSASIGGAAAGGILIALWGPGTGLAVDAASFAVAGVLRSRMDVPGLRAPAQAHGMWAELVDGWREFSSHRWVWVVVVQLAVFTTASSALTSVLGPLVADAHLGGAGAWGFVVAAYGLGAVGGGLVMLRVQPARKLLAGILSLPVCSLLFFALAVPLPTVLVAVAGLLAGAFFEVFEVNWALTLQQEIPPDRLSRISSYDALANYALTPVGTAVAGALAGSLGASAVLTVSGLAVVVLAAAGLTLPEIRTMSAPRPPAPGAAVDAADPGTPASPARG